MKRFNKMLAGIATLAVTAGMAYAATSAVSSVSAPTVSRSALTPSRSATSISIDVADGVYEGGLKLENGDTNVGYARNGGKATYTFTCPEAGVYQANINFYWFQNAADFIFTVTDKATGRVEATTVYNVDRVHEATITLGGKLTAGEKSMSMEISSTSTGWIANWYSFTIDRVGDSFAQVNSLTPASDDMISAVDMAGYDYNFNISADYSASTVDFTIDHEGTSAIAVATVGDNAAVIEPVAGVYSIPTPAANQESVIAINITPADGAYSSQTTYNVRFFHLGDVTLTDVTVGGLALSEERIAELNDKDEMLVLDEYIFTSYPDVVARFMDGSSVTAERVSADGTEAVYRFAGKSGDKTKTFNITLQGIHIYSKSAADKERGIRYDATYKQDDGTWSDGLFTIDPCGDGWGGTQFKLKGSKVTLSVPSDMIVKQLTLGGLADNYAPGKITSITTNDDAVVYLPSASSFTNPAASAYDLVVNVENHVAGTPFVINIEGGSQPVMWFDFVYDEFVLDTPVAVTGKSHTDLTGKNHAVVTIAFDRVVNDAEITFNGKTVKADGGKPSLSFALWDMDYDKEYTLTIPAGAVTDAYGNANTEAISYSFTTGSASEPVEAIAADRFIEVSDVDALRAAVVSLASTNNSADAATTIIYIHNGDYDLGSVELALGKVFNVSILGESEEGVLIHGIRDGISNPVFSTRNSTNIYMENFTVRNDLDFGKSERVGVGVAHYGGNLDIMKNVTLQSIQDTQVTGERGYYLNCTIHGSVDYICGGGDHFYDNCTIVHEIAGGYITAPATSSSLKHGYVFSNCTIKGVGPYDLGRPWQNEPRAFFINTTMEALPSDAGWGKMSDLVTHFYEYGSKDANGTLLDLSVRKNSPTSTNSYSPILPEQYVSYFTVENVLGSTDSWLATELTATLAAPSPVIKDGVISWDAVPKAAGYILYADGEIVGYTAETSCSLASMRAADPTYTVQAVNANGARGIMSEAVVDDSSAITDINVDNANAPVEYFNLQGIRVNADQLIPGIYVVRQGNKTSKVLVR